MKYGFLLFVSASAVGCGGRASESSNTAPDGGSTTSSATSACVATVDAGPPPTGRVPLYHRVAACCPTQRPPGTGPEPYPPGLAARSPDGGVACTTDAECTAGKNGRCFPFEDFGPGGCSYDECSTDSDCPSGSPCECRSTQASDNGANVCGPVGNCTVDSDCGAGGFCSPSQTGDCFSELSYYCRTPGDTCLDDTDCPAPTGKQPDAYIAECAYDPSVQHWACTQLVCLPP